MGKNVYCNGIIGSNVTSYNSNIEIFQNPLIEANRYNMYNVPRTYTS